MARVAVVGAGAAGLSAAWTLARAGVAPTVFEALPRVGGALRTEELAGARVDTGVQLVSSTHSALFELAEATVAGALRPSPGRDALWRKGSAHAITYGSVSSMATSGALPTRLKLRLAARYLPYLSTTARSLDANDPVASGGARLDRESIGAWGARELGDDFVELLSYPLLAAYYGATPEETSAAVYHALARVGMDVTVFAAAGGFGAVAERIAADVERRHGTFRRRMAVERIAGGAGGAELAVAGVDEHFDGVVCATPADTAARLLTDGPGGVAGGGDAHRDLTDWLRQVDVRSTFTVAFRIDREYPGDYFGLSFPRRERPGNRIAAVCVQSRKLPGLVPSGDALVVLPAPGAVAGLLDRPDDEIARVMLEALESAVRGVSRRVVATHVARFSGGYTVFRPGHLQRLQALRTEWLPPRVTLAGDYLVAPSVEGAVRSGVRAAHQLLQQLPATA